MEGTTNETVIANSAIKLLIVDDREDNLFSMETILEQDRYTIRTAKSGRDALKILLKEHDFTLILMDIQMPMMNGFETASLIHERDKLRQIPIIFITAFDNNDQDVFKGYELGCVDYIYKPVNPELLRAKVAVFVDLHKKNRELQIQELKLKAANKSLESEIEIRRITEKKINILNKQLVENIYQLKSTNKELERFAFVASHDLKEPIRKILTFANMLKGKEVESIESQNLVERIIRSSTRMQQLVNNLLELSQTFAQPTDYSDTDLDALLDEVLTDLDFLIRQKNAEIKRDKLPTLNVVPEHFRQLFQNLLTNALKFSREDVTPRVVIRMERVKGLYITGITYDKYEDDFLRLTIADNGIGFEEQYADQIFTIFKRLHSAEEYEGTGIGLYVCKKVVERYDGHIHAAGKPGEGATFTIVLPITKSAVLNEEPAPPGLPQGEEV